MYVTDVKISNIRSIRHLTWSITSRQAPGWHVVIGDNGSGKSTFLRAIVLALLENRESTALRQDWSRWIRTGNEQSAVDLTLYTDEEFDDISEPVEPYQQSSEQVSCRLFVHLKSGYLLRITESDVPFDESHEPPRIGRFSASFGPFRRFTGGDSDHDELLSSNPRLAAHLSLFGENIALKEALAWLQELRFKELEQRPEAALLTPIRSFVNQEGFLPFGVRLSEISSSGIEFMDGSGCSVSVLELSDGYRSILSMTFELIRQMVAIYGPDRVFAPGDPTRIIPPGVVLIDEVDAHLHPTWQREIGKWFTKHFPNIQFIVSTHSPLVCQAAEHGTIFRLPRPGTDETGEMVTGRDLERLVYGNVLDAYGTDLFGESVEQSDTGRERLERLAQLNVKELRKGLTDEERREQEALRGTQPSASGTLAVIDGETEA